MNTISIQQIEEASMLAWPALNIKNYDGWLIQEANGLNYRSNCVNPIYFSKIDVLKKLEYCENFYKKNNLPCVFKISEIRKPSELDLVLKERGYNRIFDISVQIADLNEISLKLDSKIKCMNKMDNVWFDFFIKASKLDESYTEPLMNVIRKINLPNCLMATFQNNQMIGCGLAAIDKLFLGLFEIIVDENYRGKGFGKLLVSNLMSWGKINGAKYAYLQVQTENTDANKLYQKLGFRQMYEYYYMIKQI